CFTIVCLIKVSLDDKPILCSLDYANTVGDGPSVQTAIIIARASRCTGRLLLAEAVMTKKLRQVYGDRRPKGYLLAHNTVLAPELTPHKRGFGFRMFWIPPEWVGHEWSECPCGCLEGTHYARNEHVEFWKAEIEKRGSLTAVHRWLREGHDVGGYH